MSYSASADTPYLPTCFTCSVVDWLNDNTGVVTAAGFILALATGLFGYLSFTRGRRVFHVLLFETLYEALHNLHHIAQAYKAEGTRRLQDRRPVELKRWPEYELRYAERILDPPYVDHFDVTLRSYIDHMLRNDSYIHQLPRTASGLREATDDVGYLAEHAMRLLVEARHTQKPEAIAIFDDLEKQKDQGLPELTNLRRGHDFPRCAIRLHETKAEAHAKKHVDELGESAPLVYWFNRKTKPSELFNQLVKLYDPPHRALRPSWWTRLHFRLRRSGTSEPVRVL
jgi:hypothetical protein